MTLNQALLLLDFHMSCNYRYTQPVQWAERLAQIEALIEKLDKKRIK